MQLSSSEYYPRLILALMMWAQFVVPLALFSAGALAPLLRDALHLSRGQLGALTALYHAGAALAAMPVGWLADRYGVRDVLIAVQAVSGLALAAISWLHTYEEILPGMFLPSFPERRMCICVPQPPRPDTLPQPPRQRWRARSALAFSSL
jgi:MFS family permease